MQKPTSSVLSSLLLMHADVHAMHHFSIKHVTVTATCTEPPGIKATRKHGAFECLCSLCSRKKDVFTDLLCTVPKFQCRYCLQVSCSKLILNTIPGAAPFILQCLHIWMYVLYTTTTKTSTTFASHHSDGSCKHADTQRIGRRLIDND